jgi:hypothetical protein
VRVPAVVAEPTANEAGWIEFGRPPPEFKARAEPEVRTYRPEEGLMLLFPSYLYHRTIPFDAEEARICIAFDVVPTE